MNTSKDLSDSFMGQKTAILVFGTAGRIGSGASFVTKAIMEEIKAFGYKPVEIKVTKWFLQQDYCCLENIESNTCLVIKDILRIISNENQSENIQMSDKAQRIKKLQDKGNILRDKYGNNIIAALSLYYIGEHLRQQNILDLEKNRYAYIIDSLKHPDEVKLLREVFQGAFYMIGAVANDSVRKRRLQDQKHITDDEFKKISEIDAGEINKNGQQTTKAILESDYFFENNYDTPEKINQECKRLLNLIFQSTIVTPKQDEYGMHLAFGAADKSACLSRQVGASIISDNGNVLATGYNDVPKFGGGLYTSESTQDNRCFAKSGMCHNDFEKQLIAEDIIEKLKKEENNSISEKQYKNIKDILLKETRLQQLIEFSRAVHAEMDAIITVARSARSGIVGSTMYVTTFPCHNCAKHIIDSGIKRVVFLEPYEKSLALKLHSDAINNPLEDCRENKVIFDNYGGVSPKRYAELFSMHEDRKKESKLIRKSFEKEKLLPLNAQESLVLKFRLQKFKDWFQDWSKDI
jgi:deoxycytidylate deaminase